VDSRILNPHKLFYRVPFLVPYWDQEELSVVRRWTTGRHSPPTAFDDLHEQLQYLGYEHCVLTSTGRFALEVALRSLRAPGAEVVIPAFACRSIAKAVIEAGCVAVFADVNRDLTIAADSVERNVTTRTAAVVVAHLSGKPASDFEALIDLCRRHSLALIDDAAQALGVRYRNRPLGTFGQFGILSFGIGKPTFSLGGGALVVHSGHSQHRCQAIVSETGRTRTVSRTRDMGRIIDFLMQYRWRRRTLPFYAATRGIRKLTIGSRSGWSPRGPIEPLEAALQAAQLRKLDAILQRFRENATQVVQSVASRDGSCVPQASADCAYTKLLVRIGHDAEALSTFLLKRGIEIERSYRPLDVDAEFARFARHPAEYARRVSPELLALPVHPSLDQLQVAHVASSLAAFFEHRQKQMAPDAVAT